jgi:hypothetical protein
MSLNMPLVFIFANALKARHNLVKFAIPNVTG